MLPGIPREKVRSDVLNEFEGLVEVDAGEEEKNQVSFGTLFIDATSAGVLSGSHLDVPTSYWD